MPSLLRISPTPTSPTLRSAQHLVPESAVKRSSRYLPTLLAASTAILFWLAFFPANQGWCAWFALVPLLILVRSQMSTRAAALTGWLIALPMFVASLQWVRLAHPAMYAAWIALAFYCSLYFPLTIWLLRRLDRLPGVPLALSLPLVWTALEYFRAHFVWGFAWYFLGHTQHDFLPMIQVADLGGVYVVSFLVAAVNGLLFEALCRWQPFRRWTRIAMPLPKTLLVPAAIIAVLLVGTLGYGWWRIGQSNFSEGPTVALLQSNIDQGTRNARSNPSQQSEGESPSMRMMRDLAGLTMDARHGKPDLMIWPETTCPFDWIEITPAGDTEEMASQLRETVRNCRQKFADIAQVSGANVLLGLNCDEISSGPRPNFYNSALLVDPKGEPLGRYDKIHCVPFGEYVPMRETCPWMRVFTPYEGDYSLTPGKHYTRFTLPTTHGDFRFGVIICYEDSDPLLARRYALPEGAEPPVDFLVNISNDGWFDGSEEHEQHFAICRFRAVESRRAVARAVNMGISGVIDSNGRVVALSGPTWHDAKKIATTVTANVPIDHRMSIYARVGDWLPAGCSAFVVLGLLAGITRRKNRPTVDASAVRP